MAWAGFKEGLGSDGASRDWGLACLFLGMASKADEGITYNGNGGIGWALWDGEGGKFLKGFFGLSATAKAKRTESAIHT